MSSPCPRLEPAEALAAWKPEAPRPLFAPVADAGLINRTWSVGEPTEAILQWVNPIFAPEIHFDIDAATRHLETRGLRTPRLLPTADGRLYLPDPGAGCWRLQSFVPGRTVHRLDGPRQAAEAGSLVGRFHRALADYREPRHAPRRAIHDTPARMAELRSALEAGGDHPLAGAVEAVGTAILAAWDAWDGELDLPERLCHGDLKISNIRFDENARHALCLIDLDTLEPMPLAAELGDAWRSWTNPAGEDQPEKSHLDLELFTASARAFLDSAPPLGRLELQSLAPATERIALELSARFAADALRNDYFREDRDRFPQPGEHNLLRARGQLGLAISARSKRSACEAALGLNLSRPPSRQNS